MHKAVDCNKVCTMNSATCCSIKKMADVIQGKERLFSLLTWFLEDCERSEDTDDRNKIEYVRG